MCNFFLSVSFIVSINVCIFPSNMRDIIIHVARWWEKYLSKLSHLKHACSWRDKLIVLWILNRQAKIFLRINLFLSLYCYAKVTVKLGQTNKKFNCYDIFNIVGNPPPLLKGRGGRTFQKLSYLGRVPKILLERGDNHEKGGGVDIEIRGGSCHFFIPLMFNCIYCVCGGE